MSEIGFKGHSSPVFVKGIDQHHSKYVVPNGIILTQSVQFMIEQIEVLFLRLPPLVLTLFMFGYVKLS